MIFENKEQETEHYIQMVADGNAKEMEELLEYKDIVLHLTPNITYLFIYPDGDIYEGDLQMNFHGVSINVRKRERDWEEWDAEELAFLDGFDRAQE